MMWNEGGACARSAAPAIASVQQNDGPKVAQTRVAFRGGAWKGMSNGDRMDGGGRMDDVTSERGGGGFLDIAGFLAGFAQNGGAQGNIFAGRRRAFRRAPNFR